MESHEIRNILNLITCPNCGARGSVLWILKMFAVQTRKLLEIDENGDIYGSKPVDLAIETDEIEAEEFRCGQCGHLFGESSDDLIQYANRR